ncbi:MAG: tetratricopeptide repeat protein [Melioribacteraceae bacterium]|jgi:TolA-binding protein|nr:tetratricopeptide repeat protein [Melioribacteraceae bacterium]
MKIIKLIGFLLISILFTFCGSKTDEENYDSAVKLLTEQKYDEAVVIFEEIVEKNQNSEFAPRALFETAKVYQGQVIKNLSGRESLLKAVSVYKKIFNDYPKSKEAENSLFMSGFILANELNDLEAAKETYELFIQKFPEGSLADDAMVELENLGKTPEEILMNKIQ